MITLFFIWLVLTCMVGVFYILETIFRSLPEGHRLRVWWNDNVITELGPDDRRGDY